MSHVPQDNCRVLVEWMTCEPEVVSSSAAAWPSNKRLRAI